MAKSQKITLTSNGNGTVTATTKDAGIADILTTAISTDTVVSGMHGLIQRGLFFAAGMAVNNKMKRDSFNFFK